MPNYLNLETTFNSELLFWCAFHSSPFLWSLMNPFLFCSLDQPAKGRTNIELREQFILADGVSQSMTAFKAKPSPNSSNVSSQGGSGQRGSFSGTAGPITKVRKQPLRCGNR